ncbi:MAG: hypothetical protein GF311_12095 [Candidatus Lokiarchaeota archaeon]|nr:hypothetical protein [Candidatus Lokiarchaeota archaeon]
MSKRLGSVDFFRGFCMFLMLLGHLSLWWMTPIDFRFQELTLWIPLEPIAKGTGFILISGTSIALSFSKKKTDYSDLYKEDFRILRNSSYIRAGLLFIVAFLMNFAMIFIYPNSKIFDWWILFTLSICLFFSWPLMKLSIKQRILIGLTLLVFNYFFYQLLLFYTPFSEFCASLMEFFFPSDTRQNPILSFFPFFLFGTVIGSYIKDVNVEKTENAKDFLKRITLPLALPSIVAIIFGVLFKFPTFLVSNSYSYIIYALGLNTLLITILLTIEKFKDFNWNSKYNPLFYLSFYSLTFYMLHYIFLLFAGIINLSYWVFWGVFWVIVVLFTIFFSLMYRLIAGLFSLKYLVSVAGEYLSLKIEEFFYNKKTNAYENLITKLKFNILPSRKLT